MKDIILKAYEIIDDYTPLSVDCGLLCDAACCYDSSESSEEDVSGMLLFPGEEELFEDCDWGYTCDTEFVLSNGYIIKLFVCEEFCPREERPLSCRVFPLFCNVNGEVITDPRSKGVCPLSCFRPGEEFSPEFVNAVKRVFSLLLEDDDCKRFIELINDEFKYYVF